MSRAAARRQKRKQEEEADENKIVLTREMCMENKGRLIVLQDRKSVGIQSISVRDKQLEHLNNTLLEFKYVPHVDISNNLLSDIPQILQFDSLITLNISNNRVKHIQYLAEEEKLLLLSQVKAPNNKITELPPLKVPRLVYLDLSSNQISKLDRFEGHPFLQVLKLRDNKLKSMQGIRDMPRLTKLDLAGNSIHGMVGYENLPELRSLNLAGNRIDKLGEEELPELPSLVKLKVAENRIAKEEEMKKLLTLGKLEDFNYLDNPLSAEENKYRVHEILIISPKLRRINKVVITQELQQQAIYLAQYKWKKAEEARIAEEKAAREREEAENREDAEDNQSFVSEKRFTERDCISQQLRDQISIENA